MEGPSNANKPYRKIITVSINTLLLYHVSKAGGSAAGDPHMFFTAPEDSLPCVRCHGAVLCVACEHGAVCILSAPFLAA